MANKMNETEILSGLYSGLQKLKRNGVKMKDIAAAAGWSPSVLSALYASVLPAFMSAVGNGYGFDDALDEALSTVNNLSRGRLLGSMYDLYKDVLDFSVKEEHLSDRPVEFISTLQSINRMSSARTNLIEGVYMSYSRSSSMPALKAEPYYFTDSPSGGFKAGRKSVHDSIREGIGIISKQNMLYVLFNAFQDPGFSLVSMYLQLPFLEDISYLKGIYLVPDYNNNPIARRIVLIRHSEEADMNLFGTMEARLIMPEEFTPQEKLISEYVCGKTDCIKMCSLPSPKLDLRDLKQEKDLLAREENIAKFNG